MKKIENLHKDTDEYGLLSSFICKMNRTRKWSLADITSLKKLERDGLVKINKPKEV